LGGAETRTDADAGGRAAADLRRLERAGRPDDNGRVSAPDPTCPGATEEPPSWEPIPAALERLSRSTFRSRFHLSATDKAYARAKGRETVVRHARQLLAGRIGDARPRNDGRQTPMRGHPVFIAQHATATCCRGCLAKWHRIAPGHDLSEAELDHLVDLVIAWIEAELRAER
jgi:hypothetical protein